VSDATNAASAPADAVPAKIPATSTAKLAANLGLNAFKRNPLSSLLDDHIAVPDAS
jgi:hypothetical protein